MFYYVHQLSPDLIFRGGREANEALRSSYIELVKRHHPDVRHRPAPSNIVKGFLKHSSIVFRSSAPTISSAVSENKFVDIQRAYHAIKVILFY